MDIGGHEIRPVIRTTKNVADTDDAVHRIRRLIRPLDEAFDLNAEQRQTALDNTIRAYQNNPGRHQREPRSPSGPYIRRARKPEKGLLLIYPIRENDACDGLPHMGYAVSFPAADMDTPVEYIVNSRYWEEAGI